MGRINVRTTTGDEVMIDEALLAQLRTNLAGQVLGRGDRGYQEAREVFNGMINRHPSLIVRCTGVADVLQAVRFARSSNLLVSVRGGGHNVAGNAVCEGGIMIDLSPMTSVRVDPLRRTARAAGGAPWRTLDRETQSFRLATTGGLISTTGIAGLTLGGGLGWLARLHGLTCDNLLSADIVTAEGEFLTASSTEHADLFWGLRGGGGNFGIVTSFEYRLHPVSSVVGGLLIHPLERAKEVLRFFREVSLDAPDTLTCYAGLLALPDGTRVVAFVVGFLGPEDEAESALRSLRSFGPPNADMIRPMLYCELQQMLDASYPSGLHHYWKSSFLANLSDEAVDTLVAHFLKAPSPQCHVIIEQLGGAIRQVARGETAFYHRDMPHDLLILGVWTKPDEKESCVNWARELWHAMQPFCGEGAYVNYLGQAGEEGAARVKSAYAGNYPRLMALKQKYDPTNFFRLNQNIQPGTRTLGSERLDS
jgi:FAD/FMN-containing dehydrogenase